MARVFNMIDTWDNIATNFNAIKMNVNDQASGPDSQLDWKEELICQ